MSVLVGDKIRIKPTMEGQTPEKVMATVIYIHPQRRYYVAEYRYGAGTPLREAFPYPHRAGK